MEKALKLTLTKNTKEHEWAEEGEIHFTLKINDRLINNSISEELIPSFDYFQTATCGFCGIEGCNVADMITLVRHGESLMFIPCFNIMDSFEEFYYSEGGERSGESECPPHQWYENGILILEKEMVEEFYKLFPKLKISEINVATQKDLDLIEEWEHLVKEKPAGFMRVGLR